MVPHLRQSEPIVAVTAGVYVGIGENTNRKREKITAESVQGSLYMALVLLTFAGLDALKPPVTSVFVAGTSAVLIPSTASSATTDLAGFRKYATP